MTRLVPSASRPVSYGLNTDSVSVRHTAGSCIGSGILRRFSCFQNMRSGEILTIACISTIPVFSSRFTRTKPTLEKMARLDRLGTYIASLPFCTQAYQLLKL
jgi:hypothetical protein